MADTTNRSPGRGRRLCFCLLSLAMLFAGFFANTWHAAAPDWFAKHQRDTEALVIGRLVKTRLDGPWSAGGLNGAWLAQDPHEQWLTGWQAEAQYELHAGGRTDSGYQPYLSQNGGQGFVFGLLDRMLPWSSGARLEGFHALTAFLTAAALTGVLLWFLGECGGWAAGCALAAMLLSQWLTVFGRNLWWSLAMFYVPMLALMAWFARRPVREHHAGRTLAALVFGAVFAKCFATGFEYLTTTLVMMVTPFVYHAVRDRLPARSFGKGALVLAGSSCLAVLASLLLLLLQIAAVKGSLAAGIEHVVWSLGRRTHGATGAYTAEYAASLDAGVVGVLWRYVAGTFLDLGNYVTVSSPLLADVVLKIRYLHLLVLFLLATLFLLARRNVVEGERRRHVALVVATWFSLLAPLSWFVVFKAHSVVHTHMNFIVWQMPFVFFGAASCGVAVRAMLRGSAVAQGARRAGAGHGR